MNKDGVDMTVDWDKIKILHKIKLPDDLSVFKGKTAGQDEMPFFKAGDFMKKELGIDDLSVFSASDIFVDVDVEDRLEGYLKKWARAYGRKRFGYGKQYADRMILPMLNLQHSFVGIENIPDKNFLYIVERIKK